MGQRLRMVGFLVKCKTLLVGIGYSCGRDSWIVGRRNLAAWACVWDIERTLRSLLRGMLCSLS